MLARFFYDTTAVGDLDRDLSVRGVQHPHAIEHPSFTFFRVLSRCDENCNFPAARKTQSSRNHRRLMRVGSSSKARSSKIDRNIRSKENTFFSRSTKLPPFPLEKNSHALFLAKKYTSTFFSRQSEHMPCFFVHNC